MARRMRRLVGCLAVVAIAAAGSTAAVAAGGSGVRQISAATWNEAARVSTMAELRAASARARSLVVTPTVEVVQIQRWVPGTTGPGHQMASGSGKARPGCHDVTLTTTKRNVFGSMLMQAKTTVRNWCTNGVRITSSPTVQRSLVGRWGWSACGWDGAFAGWLHASTRFGAGGDALFAQGGSCAAARPQSHHDVQVHGNGTHTWSY
jgi:hypothetical protein